jgi:hypothetical protein
MPTTVALDRFLPLVLPHCPGVPEFTATRNLRLAAIEFCERTRCWRHLTTVQIDTDGQAVAAPDYAAIHLIERATWEDGTPLTPLQFSHVDEQEVADTIGQLPIYVTQATYNTVRVIPFKEGNLALSLFLKPVNGEDFAAVAGEPTRDALDVLPEFIWTMHAEPIASGAIARILGQQKKPWTDLNLAMMHQMRFERAMDSHFAVALKGQHRARVRSTYRDL